MKKNMLFFPSPRIFMVLFGVSACLSLSLTMLFKLNPSKAQNIPNNDTSANVETQERLEGLKATMLTTWQQQAQAKGIAYNVPSRFQGAVVEVVKLPQSQKVIALTFDDGPWPHSTDQVLSILKENNIKATFFMIGQNVKSNPALAKQVVAGGHVVGNHTWHHWYHYLNTQAAAYEIDHTTAIIQQTTGVKTDLFRPPGGIMNNGVVAYARNSKYTIIMWSSDSSDYSHPGVSALIHNIFKTAKPGGIVLMHDGGGNRSQTLQALPEVISRFRSQGYQFVTIPELLTLKAKDQKLIANKK
jgi:chitin deacetylase